MEQRAGNIEAAEQRYRAIVDNNPNQPDALVAMAGMAAADKRGAEALELLQRARENNPHALNPRLLLGHSYIQQRQWQQALEVAQESVTIAPKNMAVLAQLGQAQRALGDSKNAWLTSNKWLQQHPTQPPRITNSVWHRPK